MDHRNTEITFESDMGDGGQIAVTYSVTDDGVIYEKRKSGWKKVTSKKVRRLIMARLSQSGRTINA